MNFMDFMDFHKWPGLENRKMTSHCTIAFLNGTFLNYYEIWEGWERLKSGWRGSGWNLESSAEIVHVVSLIWPLYSTLHKKKKEMNSEASPAQNYLNLIIHAYGSVVTQFRMMGHIRSNWNNSSVNLRISWNYESIFQIWTWNFDYNFDWNSCCVHSLLISTVLGIPLTIKSL